MSGTLKEVIERWQKEKQERATPQKFDPVFKHCGTPQTEYITPELKEAWERESNSTGV